MEFGQRLPRYACVLEEQISEFFDVWYSLNKDEQELLIREWRVRQLYLDSPLGEVKDPSKIQNTLDPSLRDDTAQSGILKNPIADRAYILGRPEVSSDR